MKCPICEQELTATQPDSLTVFQQWAWNDPTEIEDDVAQFTCINKHTVYFKLPAVTIQ